MSRFLTPKMLKFGGLPVAETIDYDLDCESCGYNLRGLPRGRACPECGAGIALPDEPGTAVRRPDRGDFLVGVEQPLRSRFRIGFALSSMAILVTVAGRDLIFVAAVLGFVDAAQRKAYQIIMLVNAVIWLVGVMMVTPPMLDRRWGTFRTLRRIARIGAPLFLAASAVLVYRALATAATTADLYYVAAGVLRLLGGASAVVFFIYLHILALSAQREAAAERFNSIVYFLPPLTIAIALVPLQITWIAAILVAIVLAFWTWMMLRLLAAMMEMESHARWTLQHADRAVGRDERIAEKRAALQREADSMIRSLPGDSGGDLPVEDARS